MQKTTTFRAPDGDLQSDSMSCRRLYRIGMKNLSLRATRTIIRCRCGVLVISALHELDLLTYLLIFFHTVHQIEVCCDVLIYEFVEAFDLPKKHDLEYLTILKQELIYLICVLI